MPLFYDIDGDGDFDFNDMRVGASRTIDAFLDFALRDNVLEVAVGLIFASQFTALASSLVSDIILPLVSLLPFLSRNIEEKFLVLRPGHSGLWNYNTIDQAQEDGALSWNWGRFVDKMIRFVIIALALFLLSSLYSSITSDNIIKRQVRCKYCRKYISEKAKRCFNCTSWVDGREDPKQEPVPHPTLEATNSSTNALITTE